MAQGGIVLRGEMFKMAFAPESSYGVDPGTSAYTRVFGVVQTATLPDPSIELFPIYALGTASKRNWFVNYMGKVTLSGSIPDIWLLNGFPLYPALGAVSTTGTYVHTITEAITLPSIAIHVTMLKSDQTNGIMRRWFGGKVNRQTIECSEGDFLKTSIDEIIFQNFGHDASGEPYYASGIADITGMSFPTSTPYLFSYGSLSLAGTEFARIRNFRLEINNNVEPKFYIQNGVSGLRLPYEAREGRRDYRLSCQVDVEDNSLYKELVRMGTYDSVFKGFQTILQFVRGSGDTITITSPGASPAVGGDSMGCLIRTAPHNVTTDPVVSTTLDIQMRQLSVVIQDDIATYPGE